MDHDLLLLLASLAAVAVTAVWHLRSHGSGSGAKLPLPPGPRGWPVLGNLPQLGAKPHHTMAALARQHGPLFRLRFGSAEVVVAASAKVAGSFLRGHDANFSDRPPNSGAEHVAYNYQDLVFAPYGARWRALRMLCALHLFSARAIDALGAVRQDEARLMVSHLLSASSSPAQGVAIGQEANVCATNALARAAVGRRVIGDGVGESAREFKGMVIELMQLAGVFNIGDFVPALRWLDPQGVVAKMKRLHRRYDRIMDGFISEREHLAGEEEGKDLLSIMLAKMRQPLLADAGEDGIKFTETNIKALLLNLFTAGTDTTSSTVEWALAELIRHPNALKQLQREVDDAVGTSHLVTEADLPRLTFLTAVIKETFRLHPSTPLSLPRVAAEDCEVDGYHVPKGTTLLVNVWAIGRDPASWGADALEFRPARFLPGGSHETVDVKGGDYELIPFGAGRRICAGLSWGLRIVTLMTATLVHAFDWSLVDGMTPDKLDMEEAYGLTLRRAVPLLVQPMPRLLPSAYAT
ncbi:hypothetical protein ACQJBY_040614 [Aegilops geniculata]